MDNRASESWPNGVKPKVGDLATAKSLGKKGRAIRIWESCPVCGRERWVKRNARGTACQNCSLPPVHYGESNTRWNKAKCTVTNSGLRVHIDEDHPYFKMAHICGKGFAILEHRLIMAMHLGRPLEPWEVVHHIDGNNLNNHVVVSR